MATEVLNVPEQHLADFIRVVRAGLETLTVDPECRRALLAWCEGEEEYLKSCADGGG